MNKKVNALPDPTPESVALWLKQLDRAKVHDAGWQAMNRRFHGITRAMRPFIREQYPDADDQEAVFDGLTLAMMAMAHFSDIGRLTELFGIDQPSKVDLEPSSKPQPQEDTMHENGQG
ncbi:MAG: hypothetical protein AAB834_01200 [Patescibacteria group bacterium]